MFSKLLVERDISMILFPRKRIDRFLVICLFKGVKHDFVSIYDRILGSGLGRGTGVKLIRNVFYLLVVWHPRLQVESESFASQTVTLRNIEEIQLNLIKLKNRLGQVILFEAERLVAER